MNCLKLDRASANNQVQIVSLLAGVAVLALSACGSSQTSQPGCSKDTDCKGQRVCESGRCSAVDGVGSSKQRRTIGKARPYAMFAGDSQNRGLAAGVAPRTEPNLLWSFDIGQAIVGSPTVGPSNDVFVTSHDGSLYSISKSGELKWRFKTKDRIWSTPAVTVGGTIYIGSDDDNLYAVDSKSGSEKWRFHVGACANPLGFGPEGSRCDADGGPTIGKDGTVYLGGDGVHAVWPDGTLRWKFATAEHVSTAPAISQNDVMLYAGCLDDSVYAIRSDGTKAWSFRTGNDVESAPTVGPDGKVYFGSDDDAIYALYPYGAVAWKVLTGGDVRSSPALAEDGTVYVGSYDRYLYAVAPNGQVRWRFPTGGRIHGAPVIAQDGTILFGSQDDRLYALSPEGKLQWSLKFSADVDASPTLTSDGVLYVAGDDGVVSAFSPPKNPVGS